MSYKTKLKFKKKRQASEWRISWVKNVGRQEKLESVVIYPSNRILESEFMQVTLGVKMKEGNLENSAYKLKILFDKKLDMGNKGRRQYFFIEWLGSWQQYWSSRKFSGTTQLEIKAHFVPSGFEVMVT